MVDYTAEYANWSGLKDKVTIQTWALFYTAEKYMNGAIFQLKRFNDTKKRHAELQSLLSLEAHSYLSYVVVIDKCFESIYKLNQTNEDLTKFWKEYENKRDPTNLFTPLRNARNFIEHINHRIEEAAVISSDVDSRAVYLTSFRDDALVYYWQDKTEKKYRKASIPINDAELDKVRDVYERVFGILDSGEPSDKYQRDDPEGYAILCDSSISHCTGSPDNFIGGVISNAIFQGVHFEER